jgi:HD-GYP domain-containing protein (c-di-GMP phosphodiesterase class II)
MKQDALDYFLQALGILFRVRRIYPPGTKQVCQACRFAVQKLADYGQPVRITLLGADTIVQDRKMEVLPSAFQALFQSLQQSSCESVRIEADAAENDLLAWMEHVISKDRSSYRGSKIVAGTLNLERHSHRPSVLAQTIAGYLELSSQAQEALSVLEGKKPEGLARAREIVHSIAARLVVGKEFFQPIHELKDFDDYTFTHALNVCVLSSALARSIGASEEFVNMISLAALCHDLGKKHVPKEILNKKGPLEPNERILIERHPTYGAKLLMSTPGVESEYPLLPVVAYQHHMGADQSGYPRLSACLKPHKFHFASLLVAVADIYDALRTVRPYRPALSVAKASTILIKDALSGRLHRDYVSTLLSLLEVLIPGRGVILSDGSHGTIVESPRIHPLSPIVKTEEGRLHDLSHPSAPQLSEVKEEAVQSFPI